MMDETRVCKHCKSILRWSLQTGGWAPKWSPISGRDCLTGGRCEVESSKNDIVSSPEDEMSDES